MAIDPNAVGATGGPVERSWTSKDCLLYALGVGAGLDELAFATEKNQKVLPTMAVVLGARGAVPMQRIGSFNPAMLVHGEQAIELLRPLPPDGTLKATGKIAAIYDKGKGAVIVTETESGTRAAASRYSARARLHSFGARAALAASAGRAKRAGRASSSRHARPTTRSSTRRGPIKP
jgi:hypothetical protein